MDMEWQIKIFNSELQYHTNSNAMPILPRIGDNISFKESIQSYRVEQIEFATEDKKIYILIQNHKN